MALDFYRLENKQHLYALDDTKFKQIEVIFETFTQWTGLVISEYDDLKITTESQQTLINIIDNYIDSADLNKDKKMTSAIIGFKGLLLYFLSNQVDLFLKGD